MAGEEREQPSAAELFFELDGPREPRRREGLFVCFWFELGEGAPRRIRRATRPELATAYRLWATHSDLRTGRMS